MYHFNSLPTERLLILRVKVGGDHKRSKAHLLFLSFSTLHEVPYSTMSFRTDLMIPSRRVYT